MKSQSPLKVIGSSVFAAVATIAFLFSVNTAANAQQSGETKAAATQPVGAPGSFSAVSAAHALNTTTTASAATPAATVAASAPARETTAAAPGGVVSGVKVHGHWVIDVKAPDGTVVQHRVFENNLNANGGLWLTGFMSGVFVPEDYMIAFTNTGTAGPCEGAAFAWCGLAKSTTAGAGATYCAANYTCSSGLTTTVNLGTNLSGPYSFVLSGSITANTTNSITSVYTLVGACASVANTGVTPPVSTVSPSTCAAGTGAAAYSGALTGTTITAVPVTAGQIIQVTVTISFS